MANHGINDAELIYLASLFKKLRGPIHFAYSVYIAWKYSLWLDAQTLGRH